jgi:hypothetical protein
LINQGRFSPSRDLISAIVSVDGALGFSGDATQLFEKTARDLKIGDLGVVAPALFPRVYNPATDPAFKRWHARRAEVSAVIVPAVNLTKGRVPGLAFGGCFLTYIIMYVPQIFEPERVSCRGRPSHGHPQAMHQCSMLQS